MCTKKIKSQTLSKLDRDTDEFFDLIKMSRENRQYIYRVFEPLTVYLFSIEQLEVIKHALSQTNNGFIVLHLDATGSVVHSPPETKKRVYYYAGVVHIKDKELVCPVFEMITSEHDGYSIGSWLQAFESFIVKSKQLKWSIFSYVVTDFSFAFINAITTQWNKMDDISVYLNIVYDYITSETTVRPKITLKLCCAHFMKLITNDINKICGSNKTQKKFFKHSIAAVFMKTSLPEVEKWFKKMVLITSKEFLDLDGKLSNVISKMFDTLNNSKDLEDIDEETETETEDTEIPHTLYQKSKFYRHFFKICEQDKKMINSAIDSDNINIFYNPLILDLILKKYLPILPLWSNIYPNLRDRDSIERFSNAPVENWFCQVKNNILKTTGLRLRCTRFIRAVREVVLSKSKECALNIDKNQCAIIKKKRIQTKNIDLGLESEENWNKKIKSDKKKSYFEKTN
ncbi:hypothetical protein TcasGA2_TC003225 [Tribolium castaneum]|uniref:MULE transposase domain-containing protein n=1 Tax=Tribolium castaneum TaxID=7070 RepID=D6WE45_TRICA|nr:hypothetical protein TcasGA2_TC003225 [Tribolium castaneum]